MTDLNHRWKADPAKWDACGRLEGLGACIGPIDDTTEHVELLRRSDGSPIQDSDIPGIVADMNTLEDATTLDLSENAITDLGAQELGKLKTVTELYLAGTNVTDAGISHLVGIPNLRALSLSGTAVSDAGLVALAKAKGLERVQLMETNVTKAGITRLKRALPKLSVEYYPL